MSFAWPSVPRMRLNCACTVACIAASACSTVAKVVGAENAPSVVTLGFIAFWYGLNIAFNLQASSALPVISGVSRLPHILPLCSGTQLHPACAGVVLSSLLGVNIATLTLSAALLPRTFFNAVNLIYYVSQYSDSLCTLVFTPSQNKVIFNYFPYPWFVSSVHVVVGAAYCILAYLIGAKKASFERVRLLLGLLVIAASARARVDWQLLCSCFAPHRRVVQHAVCATLLQLRDYCVRFCLSCNQHALYNFSCGYPSCCSTLQPITSEELTAIAGPASMHAIGHVAANLSFAAVAISLTHTVKTLEPAFNVVLSRVRTMRCTSRSAVLQCTAVRRQRSEPLPLAQTATAPRLAPLCVYPCVCASNLSSNSSTLRRASSFLICPSGPALPASAAAHGHVNAAARGRLADSNHAGCCHGLSR